MRAALARGAREALTHGGVGRVDVTHAAALGVFQRDEPDRGELDLTGVVQDERDDVVLVAERSQRRFEVDIEKVRDHEHDVPLLRDVREIVGHARDLRPRSPRLGEEKLADHVKKVMAPLLGRDELLHPVREQDQADAVVVMERGHRKERCDVSCELALRNAPCPEPRARGDIDRDIDVELALLAILLDVRRVHARRHVPVNGADVIAGLVLTDFFEIEPRAAKHASVRPQEGLVGQDPRLDLDLLHHAQDLRRYRLPLGPGMERGGHR